MCLPTCISALAVYASSFVFDVLGIRQPCMSMSLNQSASEYDMMLSLNTGTSSIPFSEIRDTGTM